MAQTLAITWRLCDKPIKEQDRRHPRTGVSLAVDRGEENDLFYGLVGWYNESVPVAVVTEAGVFDDWCRLSLAQDTGDPVMEIDEDVEHRTVEKLAHRFRSILPRYWQRPPGASSGLGRRHRISVSLPCSSRGMVSSMQAWTLRGLDPRHYRARLPRRTLLARLSAGGGRRLEPVDFEGEERPQEALPS